eukprot:TRINITY_DN2869_c0_g1_i2.p1 TRINITY_DN2869_c0_g1~~TRINITY_DN2869_c0_g1_i2.p1  ORF type:complete len:344 (-),score=35.20 TRINITY_DN2869_c0_g1_i2:9-1040(-)
MEALASSLKFFDLPTEIVSSMLCHCAPDTMAYVFATCRSADTYLRSTNAQFLWDSLLSGHFGPNWLQMVDNRVGVDHKTPLYKIYFDLAKNRHIDFRLETSEDPKIDYPHLGHVVDRHHCEGLIRIAVAGELHPGKSSLINSFIHYTAGPAWNQDFHFAYLRPLRPQPLPSWAQTIRGPTCDPNKPIMDMRVGLFIVDMFGGERRFRLPVSFLKICSAWILCFDITRKESFSFVESYVDELLQELPKKHFGEGDNYRVIIVGTHLDEADKRQVSVETADALAAKIDGMYLEVDNQMGDNGSLPFLILASQCWRSPNLRDRLLHRALDKSTKRPKAVDKKCLLQ